MLRSTQASAVKGSHPRVCPPRPHRTARRSAPGPGPGPGASASSFLSAAFSSCSSLEGATPANAALASEGCLANVRRSACSMADDLASCRLTCLPLTSKVTFPSSSTLACTGSAPRLSSCATNAAFSSSTLFLSLSMRALSDTSFGTPPSPTASAESPRSSRRRSSSSLSFLTSAAFTLPCVSKNGSSPSSPSTTPSPSKSRQYIRMRSRRSLNFSAVHVCCWLATISSMSSASPSPS